MFGTSITYVKIKNYKNLDLDLKIPTFIYGRVKVKGARSKRWKRREDGREIFWKTFIVSSIIHDKSSNELLIFINCSPNDKQYCLSQCYTPRHASIGWVFFLSQILFEFLALNCILLTAVIITTFWPSAVRSVLVKYRTDVFSKDQARSVEKNGSTIFHQYRPNNRGQ